MDVEGRWRPTATHRLHAHIALKGLVGFPFEAGVQRGLKVISHDAPQLPAPQRPHRHFGRQKGNKGAGLSFLTPDPVSNTMRTHTHTVLDARGKALTWVYAKSVCMEMCFYLRSFMKSTLLFVL